MENEILETVLKEMLEEQKKANDLTDEQNKKLGQLTQTVEKFEQRLDQVNVIAPPADTGPIQTILKKELQTMNLILENQPKSVIRQARLVLFPETNPDRYYKIVFGRLIPWVISISVVFFLIPLGKQYIDTRTQLQRRRYYFEVYRDAWERLDSTLGKPDRLKMKQALQKSVNDHQADE